MLLCLFWRGKATDEKCEAFGANSLIKSWCVSVTLCWYGSVWAWNSFPTKFILWTCDILMQFFPPPPCPNTNWQRLKTGIQLPRVTWFPGTVAIPQASRLTKQKIRSTSQLCINWNVSENTFGVIFRNVSFGDDRIVRVFLTVSAHQSFRVHIRRRKEKKKTLWSAIFRENNYRQQEEMPDRPLQSLTKML